MVKLLALDLDGTLLDSRGKISEANRDAIRSAEESGVLVTIATGRRFRDALPVGRELELNAPLVTHNGALLKYADSLETVSVSLLSSEACLDILKVGKGFGGDALVSTNPNSKGTLLYDRVSDDNLPLKKYLYWSKSLHGDEAENSVVHVARLEDEIAGHDVIHISFSGTCAPMYDMQRVLEDGLGDSATILATIYPHLDFTLIDILPPDASKGAGVKKLADINGIDADDVMAIGDNFNDIEMLEFAGVSVVMGNADPNLLGREEFYTTVSNDESGVAAAINKFIFQRENY